MYKNATKCNETISKWCKNKHGASKIIDTFETYHMLLEYVRVLHFWLRFYGSAKHFCVILLKKSIWSYKCARRSLSADRHDHNRPSFASWLIFSNAAYFYGSPLLCLGLWLTVYMILWTREDLVHQCSWLLKYLKIVIFVI
jgi:hypothetical protein